MVVVGGNIYMSRLHWIVIAFKFAILFAALGVCCASVLGQAQQRAALSGTVTDISGAVIPSASVVVRSASGGVPAQTVSDGQGGFRVVGLAAGDYTITANATGFSPAQ